ncbi:hypothetical protein [Thioclava sp. GXIMD4215]|uniref:hypothetical protein n=1 Tax=Thioclava sp. GXIMD4215 TaxID=3131928 RepID=UPI003248AF90
MKILNMPNWLKLTLAFLAGNFFQPIIEEFGRQTFVATKYDAVPKIEHCIPVASAKVVVRGEDGQVLEVNPTTFFNETTVLIDNTTEEAISDFRVTIIPFGSINQNPIPMYSSVVTSSIAYADSIQATFDDSVITLEMPIFPKNTQIAVRNILNEPVSYYVEMSSSEERYQLELNPSCDSEEYMTFLPVPVQEKFSDFCSPSDKDASFACKSPTAQIEISDEMRENDNITLELVVNRTDGREAEYESMRQDTLSRDLNGAIALINALFY